MLIPFHKLVPFLASKGISVKGVIHIGAHECEELPDYLRDGVAINEIDWIEANPALVARMATRGVVVHNAAISDIEADLPFHITNNGQSSSLLEFGTHEASYPWCKVVETITVRTKRLDTFIIEKSIPMERRNFWNLDIQGAELNALRSAGDNINFADAIYAEVNTQEVYKGCGQLPELDTFLASKGFKREMISMTPAGWGDALYVRVSSAEK
jgi:FkbM family methyltransferase